MPHAPHIDWNQAQITEPGTTLRAPVVGATPEWCTEFKAEAELRRHTTFQDPWGQIGLIGVVVFVPAITPGTVSQLRETLDAMVATAQRRADAARPPEDPADMLSLMRSLSGSTLPG